MVGIFSKLSASRKGGHRRSQSTLDQREMLPQSADAANEVTPHGIEMAIEFKPVDYPVEPIEDDQPSQCPPPEPSILNDGRIWKKRVSATTQRIADMPAMKESGALDSESTGTRPRHTPSNRLILPSISAPEHNLLKLLEECNASGI